MNPVAVLPPMQRRRPRLPAQMEMVTALVAATAIAVVAAGGGLIARLVKMASPTKTCRC
jgi:hypothetical protein